MTIADFQRQYNVSRSTVYRLNERRLLPFVHVGRAVRIKRADAENWFASLTGNEANDG